MFAVGGGGAEERGGVAWAHVRVGVEGLWSRGLGEVEGRYGKYSLTT